MRNKKSMRGMLAVLAFAGLLSNASFAQAWEAAPQDGAELLYEETTYQEGTTELTGNRETFVPLLSALQQIAGTTHFGKTLSAWTNEELANQIRATIPNLTAEESTEPIEYKDGTMSASRITRSLTGQNGSIYGRIGLTRTEFPDGSYEREDSAVYGDQTTLEHIYTTAKSSSNGTIYDESGIGINREADVPSIYTLEKTLSYINNAELCSWIRNETALSERRLYRLGENESILITPNQNWNTGLSPDLTSRYTIIAYNFSNHTIEIGYMNGTLLFFTCRTTYTPVTMYRLYNPNTGEHFYTSNAVEVANLVANGWAAEGPAWTAPALSDSPVYRLYNPNTGDHHYTLSAVERNSLVAQGWNDEGIGWYSYDRKTSTLYRLFNPNLTTGSHHYTTDPNERAYLISIGWQDEGIGWYGM